MTTVEEAVAAVRKLAQGHQKSASPCGELAEFIDAAMDNISVEDHGLSANAMLFAAVVANNMCDHCRKPYVVALEALNQLLKDDLDAKLLKN